MATASILFTETWDPNLQSCRQSRNDPDISYVIAVIPWPTSPDLETKF